MHTRCPQCETLFNIKAAQLRAAHGTVRCGQCHHVFDALEYLSDGLVSPTAVVETHGDRMLVHRAPQEESISRNADLSPGLTAPTPSPSESTDETPQASIDAEPLFSTGVESIAGSGEAQAPASSPAAAPGWRAELERTEGLPTEPPPADAQGEELSRIEAKFQRDDPSPSDEPEAVTPPRASSSGPTVPEVLQADFERIEQAPRRRRGRYLFGGLSVLLLVVLGLQYAWFMPEDMARRYPQTRALLQRFCPQFGCVLPARRDPAQIRVLSRDVRIHPKFEGALLVTAAIVNAATFSQPHPRVRFSLFNVNGQIIASRVFAPGQYLSPDLDAKASMVPDVPTQITLDLLAPDEAPVSFEFQFL